MKASKPNKARIDAFWASNFAPVLSDPEAFAMTWEGYCLVVMGLDGEQARWFKVRFIEAFQGMREALDTRAPNLPCCKLADELHAEFLSGARPASDHPALQPVK